MAPFALALTVQRPADFHACNCRGWGHTWPGHFLPSDRVGHWSDMNGGPGGSASMIFEQVEPQLPPGWE